MLAADPSAQLRPLVQDLYIFPDTYLFGSFHGNLFTGKESDIIRPHPQQAVDLQEQLTGPFRQVAQAFIFKPGLIQERLHKRASAT
ncbi:unnamed protein product [Dibothriocephalus latus]|uniref:Uncharacterized protein n=1 Tax=Dibothriocephalus latus TaxID=60516 RepID=A0A3P7M8A8_DIBLA|nr:unnamed protein product [Dibothriocephalus latus]